MKSSFTRFILAARSRCRWGTVAFMALMLTSGSLSAQVFTYEESFTQGQTPGQQCTNWTSFRAQLTSGLPYVRLAMSTSANSTVVECNDGAIVAQIANALLNNTAGTWQDGSNLWNVGGCGGGPELSVNSSNCNCANPGWVVRPCIGNDNWGGIGTTTCFGPSQTMKVEFFAQQEPHDLKVDKMFTPFNACGSATDQVSFLVKNWGQNDESNIDFACEVTGTMDGVPVSFTLNETYTGTITSLGQATVTFSAPFNTNASGSLTFKIYSSMVNDDDRTNDSITVVKNFIGTPSSPTTNAIDRCGVGSVSLVGNPAAPGDNIMWFDAATGGNYLGQGANFTSPMIYNTTTFYAAGGRVGTSNSFTNLPNLYTYLTNNPSVENGGMMDITPSKTMIINNIAAIKQNPGTANWKVYMRVGSFVGQQQNPNAWTLVGSSTNVAGGIQTFTNINIGNIVLEAGVTYGFYIQCLGSDVWCTYNPTPFTGFTNSNDDITIQGGIQLAGPFASNGYWSNYHMNVRFNYTTVCMSNRVPLLATVKPMPNGTTILKGTTFNGQFLSGTSVDPDITASADVIAYEIQPPTGYQNSGFGTTWTISSVQLRTPNGTNLPVSNYTIVNPGSANGRIEITPPANFTDSTIIGRVFVNANGCDSMIQRTIFIAPRPVGGFTGNPVCEGAPMNFKNTSTISSGTVSYIWRFGDGDSSTHINPNHVYPGTGTYNAQLVVTSNYGYTSTVNKTVTVYENPQAEFAHTNVCDGAPTPFSDGSIIPAGTPTYVWDFGDGSAAGSGSAPVHQYATTGVYTVKMKVTANGCSDETTRYVTYSPRAVPNFATSVAGCNNDPVTFTNNSTLSQGQAGYVWEFGENNATSTQTHTSYEYSGYGTFNIKLTATTDMGCVNTITKSISLIEAPVAAFTHSSLCDVDQVDFTNTSGEPAGSTTTYSWLFSDGSSFNSKNITKTFSGVGTHTVTLKATATNGCSSEVVRALSIDESPKAEFYTDNVCAGSDVELMNATVGNNGNVTYDWNLGAGGTSTVKNPVVSLPVGTHNIKLIVNTPGGCTDEVTKSVTVYAVPTVQNVDIQSNNSGDGAVVLTADVTNGANYMIFWGDGQRDPGTSAGSLLMNHTYTIDGKFFVEIRVDQNNCHSTANTSTSILRMGTSDVASGELKVYPNPSAGIATVDISGLTYSTIQVDVLGINGQMVNAGVETGNGQAVLDLTGQTPGVYWVRVSTDQGQYFAKLTVVN